MIARFPFKSRQARNSPIESHQTAFFTRDLPTKPSGQGYRGGHARNGTQDGRQEGLGVSWMETRGLRFFMSIMNITCDNCDSM